MTLYDLIHKLKDIALRLPNVRTFAEGSVYDVMNGKNNIEYDCIVLSQDTHRADESFNYFTFNIFYISRLVSDMEENRLQVQSLGIEVLNNLFNILSDKYDIEIENNIQYNPFTQKFVDECCGVYASLVLNVPKEFLCAEQLFSDNSAPIISIKNTTISKEYTKNGDYSITYDKLNYTGIERVDVKVAVDYTDELNSAREEGYNQGNAEGYAKGTQDGYDNGYSIGEEIGYNNGVAVGKEEQKALLESVTITKNGTYTKDDGYGEVIVDIPDVNGSYDEGYNVGKEEGIAQAVENLPVIDITENGSYYTPSKAVNVNVTPKINIAKEGIKFSYSTFTEIPDWVDWSNIRDMSYMFYNCNSLQTIPLIDTSNVTDMIYMFYYNENIKTIPLFNTSNVTKMNYMFAGCDKLETIPQIDTSNVTDMNNMFFNCASLQTIPELNTRKVTNMSYMFQLYGSNNTLTSLPKIYCDSCTSINGYFYAERSNLTDVGGWIGLKINWNDNNGLAKCPNLSYESCINILNGLYDFTGNGETPNSKQGQLKVHSNFLTAVGDEINIAIQKGWQVLS